MRTDRVSAAMRLMPTACTSPSQSFNQHISCRLQRNKLLSNYFTSRKYKTLRWSTYISKLRALAMLCNGVMANKETIVAFGNGAFAHNARGRPSSLTKGAKRQLAGRCRLYEVDERNTSAKCCACWQPLTGMDLGTGMHLPILTFNRLH